MSVTTDDHYPKGPAPQLLDQLFEALAPLARIGWDRLMESDEARAIALLLGGVAAGWIVRDAIG